MATEETTYRTVSSNNSTMEEMGMVVADLQPNEKINLKLYINDANYLGFYSNLRLLLRNKRENIHSFLMDNDCQDNANYLACLDYFIRFILNNNETKRFHYFTVHEESMHLERSTKLAKAIRSTNHGQIESFIYTETFTDQEGMQRVWDSLHDMGVQHLWWKLTIDDDDDDDDDDDYDDDDDDAAKNEVDNNNDGNDDGNDDDNNYDEDDDDNNYDEDDERETVIHGIDLMSFSNNTLLKLLHLEVYPSMRNMTDLFDAMKTKQELESLEINFHNDHFRREEKLLVKNMLLQNHSLTRIKIIDNVDTRNELVWDGNDNDGQSSINTLLNINRDFKSYISLLADVPVDADEVENAYRIKVRTLVNIYMNATIKPIMRDTITFILLNEYKLVLIQNVNGIILQPIILQPIIVQNDRYEIDDNDIFVSLPHYIISLLRDTFF